MKVGVEGTGGGSALRTRREREGPRCGDRGEGPRREDPGPLQLPRVVAG